MFFFCCQIKKHWHGSSQNEANFPKGLCSFHLLPIFTSGLQIIVLIYRNPFSPKQPIYLCFCTGELWLWLANHRHLLVLANILLKDHQEKAQKKLPDTLRRDEKAMTGGESQRRNTELSAWLTWVYNLSCTAGGNLKEEEGGQDPTDTAHITSCLYVRIWRERGISSVVISPNGDPTAPCIIREDWFIFM